MQIYAFYLLPVEAGMARTSTRPATVNHWLESKVRYLSFVCRVAHILLL